MFSKEILRLFSDVLIIDVVNLSNYAGGNAIILLVLILWGAIQFFFVTLRTMREEEKKFYLL
jgi:hypothetical protein